jgi:pimeloyl-ACP methyl ester carboxylesterase
MDTCLHVLGEEHDMIIVMIHGTGMSWDMLMNSAEILKEKYCVVLVSVPGHDPKTTEEFTSIEQIADEIETGLIEMGRSSVDLLYGLSMGGGIAIRILADNRLSIEHAVIDAGITPYEMPWIATRLILVKDFLMMEWGKHSKWALSLAFPAKEYTQEGLDRMHQVLRHMTPRTIWHVYDSTDNYSMPATFPALETSIEYWYGSREEKDRKLDIQYVQKHIPGVQFRKIDGMMHGQYASVFAADFAEDIKKRMSAITMKEENRK